MAAKPESGKKSGRIRRNTDTGEKDRLIVELKNRIAVLETELRLKQDSPTSQEITEHEPKKETLWESEKNMILQAEEFETLMDIIPAAVWVSRDKDCAKIIGNVLANQQFTETETGENISAGSARGEVYDRTRRFFKNGRELKPAELPMQEVVAKGVDVVNSEIDVLLPSGRQMTILGNAKPLRSADGKVRGCVSVFIDITERKRIEDELRLSRDMLEQRVRERTLELQRSKDGLINQIEERKRAEEALRNSERLYRAIGESIDYGVWVCAPDGRNIYASESFLKLVGMTQQQCSDFGWGDVLHPDDAERTIAAWKECVRTEGTWDIEHRYLGVDGKYHPLLARGVPVRNENGKIIYWAGINLDIDRLKRTQEELKDAKEQAELYLDLMGHDISNMHQIILGQLELAQGMIDVSGRLEGENKELIDTSVMTLQRSAKLIESIRNVQKLRSGEYKFELVDLGAMLDEVVQVYAKMPDRDIDIDYTSANGYYLIANPLLKDIFVNLLDNAVKHCEDPVRIGVNVSHIEQNGNSYYQVVVEDNGCGVPDKNKVELFNRLKRGDTKARGTGLGLYIVKTLVEGFGGTVEAKDRVPGDHTKGARFVVMLPAVEGR